MFTARSGIRASPDGATIPKDLLNKIEAVEDDAEAVRHIGMYHATQQCLALLEQDVVGIHFYTLNRSTATRAIYQFIQADLRTGQRGDLSISHPGRRGCVIMRTCAPTRVAMKTPTYLWALRTAPSELDDCQIS